jgi:hypothetical protein
VAYGLSDAVVSLNRAAARKTIYNLAGAVFLDWAQDVDVVRSTLPDNSSNRVYFTGDDVPKVTDLSLAVANWPSLYPRLAYTLGLPIPNAITKATETVVAPGTNVETRAYVSTQVSPWGEESPPSSPLIVNAHDTGCTVQVENIGLSTRTFDIAPFNTPLGAPVTAIAWITAGAGAPGFLRLTLGSNWDEFRPGDRVHYQADSFSDQRYKGYLIGAVNTGAHTVDLYGNIWDNVGAGVGRLWRIPPINRYNIYNATNLGGGRVKVFVDTLDGLRVGERVSVGGVVGMGDLNASFLVDKMNNDFRTPSFEVLLVTAQVYVSGGYAERDAKYNTSELRVIGCQVVAGTCLLYLENIAGISIGSSIMVFGIMGAWQANGLRTVANIDFALSRIMFPLAAVGAYVSGGGVIQESPDTFESWTVANVVQSGGVYPGINLITITTVEDNTLTTDDLLVGYDIGGAAQANTMLRVQSVSSSKIFNCNLAGPLTAFTAGGRVAKLKPQFKKRLYRTATGSQDAEYEFLAEINGDEGRYVDRINTAALGDVIESTDWIQPPVNMKGIIAHPHGFLLGFSENEVLASEVGQLHAWPLKNRIPVPYDVVALGMFDTTTIAFTTNVPIYIQGLEPGKMTRGRSDVGEPCTSKRTTYAQQDGVFYRGNSGMLLIGSRAPTA